MTDCDNYTFSPNNLRPSIVPGLNYQISVTAQAGVRADTTGDLENVHTVPDPYYVTTSLEATANDKQLQFVNLPTNAIIRIYSVSGILVTLLEHNDPTGGGTAWWDMRNRNSQIVASVRGAPLAPASCGAGLPPEERRSRAGSLPSHLES